MADVKTWMPLYCGDYLRDTTDLSHAEHGAYMLTMMAYWVDGESLLDRKFRKLCGKEFGRVSEFYSLCDGRWHHKRIDEELAKANARQKMAIEKSKLGVAARAEQLRKQAGI